MNFLHPWALALGALALAAPIAVHFLTRPKPAAFPLATIRFIQEIIEQRKARSRFRDWLILMLRLLAIALLAMTLARPLLSRSEAVSKAGGANAARVVLVDVSQSMSAGIAGNTCIASAQAAALEYLESTPGMEANVVFAGAKPRQVFNELSTNFSSLRDAVRKVHVRSEKADVRSAMEEVARLFRDKQSKTRELVIISDFQRSNWSNLFLDALPKETKIQMRSVGLRESDNVAITGIRFSAQPIMDQSASLEVDVANYSEKESSIRCQVQCGSVYRSLEATIPSQSSRTLSTAVQFAESGWKSGWATLESNVDMLPGDDRRPLAVFVRPQPRIMLLTQQNSNERPSSSFFVEQALRIAMARDSKDVKTEADIRPESTEPKSLVRVHSQRSNPQAWPDVDVYVVDHPGTLNTESLQTIASRVRRGKGLLYITSDLTDGVNMQQLDDMLGSGFQPPVQLVPTSTVRKDLFIRSLQSRQTPFQVLGANSNALRPVRFGGGLATTALAEGLRDQVLAELSDSSALLYLTSVDAGQIAVLNTDLGRTNWCVQSTFLPVMSELLRTLLTGRRQSLESHSGEVLVRMLPPEITSETKLIGSVDTIDSPIPADFGQWEWSAGQGAVVWNWPDPPGPGLYSLKKDGVPAWTIATAAPAVESDLSKLNREVLVDRVADGRSVGFSNKHDDAPEKDSLWSWLIVACTVGLIGEILALRWFRA
ncbi:MAG: BatA domain-containing protein [Pirellula sp.]